MPGPAAISIIQQASAAFVGALVASWFSAGQPAVGISSFFRSVAENQRVGGLPDSQHLIATAIDLTGETSPLLSHLRSRGLVVVERGSHVHVQLWPASAEAVRILAPDLIRSI